MDKNLLKQWLVEFKDKADEWFESPERRFVKERYEFFNKMYTQIRNGQFSYNDLDNICDRNHSLTTNKLALAFAKGEKKRHHSKDNYLIKFQYLINTDIDIVERINNLLKPKSKFKMNRIADSSISELIAYNEPEKYTFLNQREEQAIKILDLNIKSNRFGDKFQNFNEIVRNEILPEYIKIVYAKDNANEIKKLKSGATLMLEIDQFFSWVFKTKKIEEIEHTRIDYIKIQNFYTIEEITLSELRDKNFIFLLGENGSGKTIFLKALLISLKKFFIQTKTKDTGKIKDILYENPNFNLIAKGWDGDKKHHLFKDNIYLKNIYAYGTNRNRVSETSQGEHYGFMTLFSENEFMKNTEEWLQKLKLAEFENKEKNKTKFLKIIDIENIIGELLEVTNLKINVSSEKIKFTIEKKEFSLNELSEGYRSVIIFVIDLIARFTKNNPEIIKTTKFKAIVLIDELDLFLHPTWAKEICNKLYRWFPNIQFFISTHSPILLQGAPKDKTVIFRLKNENNKTIKLARYEGKDIETWLPNILISSPLFDTNFLDDIPEKEILQKRTEDSYPEMEKTKKKINLLREKEKAEKFYLENLL